MVIFVPLTLGTLGTLNFRHLTCYSCTYGKVQQMNTRGSRYVQEHILHRRGKEAFLALPLFLLRFKRIV